MLVEYKMLEEMNSEELQEELHHAYKWLKSATHEVEIAAARVAVVQQAMTDRMMAKLRLKLVDSND